MNTLTAARKTRLSARLHQDQAIITAGNIWPIPTALIRDLVTFHPARLRHLRRASCGAVGDNRDLGGVYEMNSGIMSRFLWIGI